MTIAGWRGQGTTVGKIGHDGGSGERCTWMSVYAFFSYYVAFDVWDKNPVDSKKDILAVDRDPTKATYLVLYIVFLPSDLHLHNQSKPSRSHPYCPSITVPSVRIYCRRRGDGKGTVRPKDAPRSSHSVHYYNHAFTNIRPLVWQTNKEVIPSSS